MEIVIVVILAAVVFGLCFLIDKGFTKLFRSQAQHRSGMAVRLSKRYGAFGIVLMVLGLAAVFAGLNEGWVLSVGGGLVLIMGLGLLVYYMTYAVFYDEDAFIFTTFGKKAKTYAYSDIRAQQLYNNQGYLLIELHMADGNAIHIQSTMAGCETFMDHASDRWFVQTGNQKEDCAWYEPNHSKWFPEV